MKLTYNEYNSKQFSMKMGDIVDIGNCGYCASPKELMKEALNLGYEHLSAKIPVARKDLVNMFMSLGFILVDTHLDHCVNLPMFLSGDLESPCLVRSMLESDIEKMVDVAERSFESDRWHSDPNLDNTLCDLYYGRWLRSCAAGYAQEVLVADIDSEPVGFLTLRCVGLDSRIDLTAVDARFRKRGIYSTLVRAAISWSTSHGMRRLLANTQIDNYGSRVTWTKNGFIPVDSNYVLHFHSAFNDNRKYNTA